MIRGGIVATALAALLSQGCAASHLIYVYDLSVGIDVAYSQEGTGRLVFGYDRGTYAVVPQKEPSPPAAKDGEIMSLAAVSRVWSKGINELQFNHFIATGKAATNMVETDPEGLRVIREAIYGRSTKEAVK